MGNEEKRQLIQETIIELHRSIKALKALDSALSNVKYMHDVNPVIRGQAKRSSMDATRALARYRKISIY